MFHGTIIREGGAYPEAYEARPDATRGNFLGLLIPGIFLDGRRAKQEEIGVYPLYLLRPNTELDSTSLITTSGSTRYTEALARISKDVTTGKIPADEFDRAVALMILCAFDDSNLVGYLSPDRE